MAEEGWMFYNGARKMTDKEEKGGEALCLNMMQSCVRK